MAYSALSERTTANFPQEGRRATETVRAMIVDDHLSFGEALACALRYESDIVVVGSVSTPWEARALLEQRVDVVLLDVHLGGHDGLQLARELTTTSPGLRLILMSDSPDPLMLETVLSLGAQGYVHKGQGLQRIIDAVRGAERDQIAIPASLFADFVNRAQVRSERTRAVDAIREILTERECEVLTLLAEGLSTKEIAAQLVLSVNTVRSHAQNTLTKLGVNSRLQAVARARESGLVSSGSPSGPYGVTLVERRRRP